MPYAVGGYPDPDSCLEILRAYARSGAGIIEVGIPFSDPLADGPVIQAASQVALRQGVRPIHVLDLAGQVAAEGRPGGAAHVPQHHPGLRSRPVLRPLPRRGILGVVVPDLPVEEATELQRAARARAVDVILLAAPTSTDARLARIAAAASGFIYCVSTTGVTGARTSLRTDLPEFVARVRRHTDLPLAVGFGVSTSEQAAAVASYADGVIIGSALVDMIARSASLATALTDLGVYLGEVGAAMAAATAV